MRDGDTFAFVPFLDLAQHAESPVANFSSVPDGPLEKFELRALRAVPAGEEVTICYGEEYSSDRFFEQYGFVPADGCKRDAQLLRATLAAALAAGDVETSNAADSAPSLAGSVAGMQALMVAFGQVKQSTALASEARFEAILDVLADDDPLPPKALLAALRWRKGHDGGWGVEEDERLVGELEAQRGEGGTDLRPLAVLEFRLARARQLELTEQVLATLLEADSAARQRRGGREDGGDSADEDAFDG
eukprot:CAMPEP_0181230786 /NCGR_PEP_ID=MMETSP1096-20121128/34691_1 /TAXON_ID=156174 ORGANISM="Chrysochromulina ericina, Strain CCMP281" /NCGR_SAMPLE_ID=MMETSP1096 /ASSEMBLY_ACC=CAM_ASM_000453 /LENGTH=246 /DNA_ID=CAMNT_0023324649 /DNA_START=29 /DNA_END=767 /DNA_ORIENTATION=-